MKKINLLLLALMVWLVNVSVAYAGTYTVKSGDMLWKIAKDHNTTIEALVEVNDIGNKDLIYINQALLMPETIASQVTKENWTLDGFIQPESILFVPNHDYIYVSNVNDQDVGYISRLTKDGRVDDYKFAEGIPFALGMVYFEGHIYIASANTVKVIDIETGEIVQELMNENVGLFNDITITPEGKVYATDSNKSKIYTSNNGVMELWYESDDFIMLNGILYDDGIIYVSNMDMENMTGSINRIDIATKELSLVKPMENIGAVDGIAKLGNKYVVSNASKNELLLFTEETVESLGVYEGGMADLGVNQETNEIYLPLLFVNKVMSVSSER